MRGGAGRAASVPHGNTARNDENALTDGDRTLVHSVAVCVVLLELFTKFILPRDRSPPRAMRLRCAAQQCGCDVTSCPGSFCALVDGSQRIALVLFRSGDQEIITASLEAVSMYWMRKAKHHLLATLFSCSKGSPGTRLPTVLSPELDHIIAQH